MAEERLQKALIRLNQKPYLKAARIAREFHVSARTLLRRQDGAKSRFSRRAPHSALGEIEEAILLRQIAQFDQMGLHMRRSTLCTAANAILRAESEPDSEPRILNDQWARRWLSRHPEIRQVKQKSMELARKEAEQPDLLRDWLLRTYRKIDELGVDLDDLWNMDETGFQIGMARNQWILTRNQKREFFVASETDRETCTIIECVSSTGSTISPLLILKGKTILSGWFRDESLSDDTLFATSETGWTNDELGLAWIQHFHESTKSDQKGVWRMLILDNHTSHETWEFAQFAIDHKIYLWGLPSHTSHLLQPLDLTVFGSYKHWHSESVDTATRSGCTKFNKIEFIHALTSIRKQTFKRGTIRSGWRDAGIVPRNLSAVLDRLGLKEPTLAPNYNLEAHSDPVEPHSDDLEPQIEPQSPNSPIQRPHSSIRPHLSTPRTTKGLRDLALGIQSDIHNLTDDLDVRMRFEKLQKGARIFAGLHYQTHNFLLETEASRIARSCRQTGPGNQTQVQKGGLIRADEARSIAKKKLDRAQEIQIQQQKLKIAAKALEKEAEDLKRLPGYRQNVFVNQE